MLVMKLILFSEGKSAVAAVGARRSVNELEASAKTGEPLRGREAHSGDTD